MWECHWLRQRSARHGKGKQLDKNEALQSVNQIKPNKPGFHLAANEFGSIVDTLALFLVPREAPLTIAQFLKSVNRTLWFERNFLSVQMDERLPNWPKKDRRLVTDVVRVDCELEMWSVIIKSPAMSNYGPCKDSNQTDHSDHSFISAAKPQKILSPEQDTVSTFDLSEHDTLH